MPVSVDGHPCLRISSPYYKQHDFDIFFYCYIPNIFLQCKHIVFKRGGVMKKILFILAGLMLSLSANAQIWFPYIRVPDKQKQMELQDLNIDVQIMGNIATTTYDMVFFNPNDKTLEGEMIFPMSPNQTVVAMALDINGKMRGASAVDKDEARRIFEEQVRRNIDPALIEKVAGNQYKMRIYPFNPKGTRRIQITTEESLAVKNNEMPLSIPLTYNKQLSHFGVKVNVVQDISKMPKVKTDFENFAFTQKDQHLTASFEKENYLLNNSLEFTLPAPQKEIVYTGSENGKNYFYSNINVKKAEKEKTLPKKIAIVWDISSSAAENRDLKKEKELLTAYLKKVKNADINLITFNIKQNKSTSFKIKKGEITPLLKAINALAYDGATRLDKVDLSSIKADEILLFTDGIATIGDSVIKPIKTPVYTIVSSDKAEFSMLSNMSNKTLGRLINLKKQSVEGALKELTHKPLRLITYKTTSAKEIYPLPSAVVGEDFTFTGLYDGKSAEIELQFGYDAKNITEKKKIKIGTNQKNTLVPRQWATHKARELELDAKNNREAIVALGKEFSILTEYTSLLVLDSLSDYLRYKVAPKDADLLEKYNRYVSLNTQKSKYAEAKEKRRAIVDTLRMANQIKKWWEKEFKQIPPEAPNEPWNFERKPEDLDRQYSVLADKSGNMIAHISPDGSIITDFNGSIIARVSDDGRLVDAKKEETPQKEAKIKLKGWSPNAPYIKELRKAKDSDLYRVYLAQKEKYQDMPAFYFDVADEFTKRKMSDKANLILTNLLEMKTDNVELLRVAAHKLQSYKQYQMAEILFKKIIDMRSEEPQGYRDLALLYEASGQNQKALEQYLFILSKKWDSFNEIKKEVFVDLNGLISRDKKLNTRDVNPNLIFNMPLDLRITLGWSARDKSVGLSVVDPYHQGAYRDENNNGGKHMYSGWGWGPESYMIKKAIEGKYNIKAHNYYSDNRQGVVLPVFAWLDVYTHFGQKNQKHERTLIRMDEIKNQELGSIDFETKGCLKETPIRYMDTCTSCDDTRKLFIPEEKCALCPNRKMFGDFCVQLCSKDKPMQSSVGNCYECNNEKALKLTEEECKKCPNREMKFGYCVLNGYNCTDDKPLREGIVTCQSCDYEKSMIVSAEDCAKCPNREMIGKYCALKQCPKDKPIQGSNGVCYDCNVISSDIVAPEDCAKCPNREMQSKYCVRQSCTADKPIQDRNGNCYTCDVETSITADKSECDKCNNRTMYGNQCKLNCSADKIQDKNGNCYTCDENWSMETTEEQCAKCPNREFDDGKCVKKTCANDKDIEGKEGGCYTCDYKGSIHTYKEECDKCSNRYMMKEYCMTACEKENQIQDTNGRCYDCDVSYAIDVDEKTCKKCPNRLYKNNRCVTTCPKDRPIMDKWGGCHACDDEYNFQTDEIECQKCPNRRQYGEYCKIACDKYEPMQDVDGNGRCYDCDYEDGLGIPKSECNKCPNREMVNDGCFEKCPDYAPLVDENGTCYTCDMEEHITRRYYHAFSVSGTLVYNTTGGYSMQAVKTSKENCSKCPNRIYRDGYCINKAPQGIYMTDLQSKQYYSCSVERPLNIPKEECDKCANRMMIGNACVIKECPDDRPIQLSNAECVSCDATAMLSISKEQCDKCVNRMMIGNACVIKECPDDRPIQLSNAECVSCDATAMLSISKEQCDKCPNRVMRGPFCTLKECPANEPMIGNNGRCISCKTDTLLSISPKECAKCPNREIKGNYCVLK